MGAVTDAPTLELLAWVSSRPRTYAETMEAWRSHCPRLLVWEDALLDGLVRVENGRVVVTETGATRLAAGKPERSAVVY
jgi:predicted transcriptional regulator